MGAKESDSIPPPKAPDGGWSWVVVACAFFNSIIIVGTPVSFGIIFSEKLTMMGVSSTTMTWIYNLFNFNFYVSSIFAAPLSDMFGWRRVGFATAATTGLGYALMVFASSPGLIFALFSVVIGYSVGLAALIGFLVIPHYFHEHCGRAAATIMTGVSTGQVIIPLLMRHLQDTYGFAGACLIYSGLVLNCAVMCLSFYPVQRRPILKGDKVYEHAIKTREARKSIKKNYGTQSSTGKSSEKTSDSRPTPLERIKDILRKTWQNLCHLRHMIVLTITLGFTLLVVGYGNFTALLPFAMAARGHLASTTSYSLSIGAAANTAVRMFVSWASDAQWFSRKICYIFGSVLSGAATLATAFVLHDGRLIMVTQILWGVGIGANLSVFHALVLDTCGRELYDSAVAASGLLLAVTNIILGPLIGLARDYTSYEVAIGLTGVLEITCAVFWFVTPLAMKHDSLKYPGIQKKSPENTNEVRSVGAYDHKPDKASYINGGFCTDSVQKTPKTHSVCQ